MDPALQAILGQLKELKKGMSARQEELKKIKRASQDQLMAGQKKTKRPNK
jgi:hypothetical protein